MATGSSDDTGRRARALPACLVLAALWSIVAVAAHRDHVPPDLSALYFAGWLIDNGRSDLVYLVRDYIRTMLAPDAWGPAAEAMGFRGAAVYPFVYPPLRAALMAPVTRVLSPDGFALAGYLVQMPLLTASAVLAVRLLQPPGPAWLWVGLVLGLLPLTLMGELALHHCLPQITVTFLVLRAFEREAAGRPGAAGLALALAAALKLYPAAFALWWLLAGERRAFAVFAVAGLALGLASLGLAGWPLHAAFLGTLGLVGGQVVGAPYNFGIENLLFQIVHVGALARDAQGAAEPFWAVEPGWMSAATAALLVAGLAGLGLRWRGASPLWRRRALLPAFLTLVSLALPIAWAHQYLLLLCLLPGLAALHGPVRAGAILAAFVAVQSGPLLDRLAIAPFPVMAVTVAGTGGILLAFLLFALAPRRPDRPGLHPPGG